MPGHEGLIGDIDESHEAPIDAFKVLEAMRKKQQWGFDDGARDAAATPNGSIAPEGEVGHDTSRPPLGNGDDTAN